jgi:hypothetical protein
VSDYDYDDQNDGPKALRELVDKLQKQLKDQEKALEAEKAEKATLSAQVKKASLADLLKKAGVDPKFAARADKDGADATEEGVKAWIEENKDFYNFGPAKPAEEAQEPSGEPNVSAEMAAAIQASQSLDASGVTPSEVNVLEKIQSLDTNPRKVSEAQLRENLAALGIKVD